MHEAIVKVHLIGGRIETAQSHQRSYINVKRRELEFYIGDFVYLKISPMSGVKRF